jgi:hypothetical protein
MMPSFYVVVNIPISQLLIEQGLVMDNIQMVIHKFFLQCSIVSFDKGINLWTVGINKPMRNTVFFQLFVK